ncbi:mechanosensitive ion channel family protein [Pseudomonas sp. M47T1]|uniref:DUF3772 domain-containing protein n=1 Tax=Pseudomonas sp. M47T1 TaxID=1179778 RepID=UPI0002607B29|nr:DUF3772 domain-containing protein [Pseudomonas sp. M47T1]EIK96214.1 mechanosensitive ion channel family protein [Pseudomonas sp. M47T1]
MQHPMLNRVYAALFTLLLGLALPFAVQAATPPAGPVPTLADGATLDNLNDQLDLIRQRVTASANDDLLASLRQAALQVQKQADDLNAQRTVSIEHLDDQLKVIGPVAADEAPALTHQRQALTTQRNALVDDQRQLGTLSQSARDLASQIVNLRRSLFNSQISTRSASPLSPAFWSSLIRPTDDDLRRLDSLFQDVESAAVAVMAPGGRWFFLASVVLAVLIWVVVRRQLERFLAWAMIRWLPEGRLRRSALALAVGLATVLTISSSASVLHWGVTNSSELSTNVLNLIDQLLTLVIFCAFIVGLGRAMLMLRRPSWRLPPIHDEIATALGPFPKILALALLIIGTQERVNSVIASSLALTVAVNGLTALAVSLVAFYALVRYHRTHRRFDLERPTGFVALIPLVIGAWVGLALLALVSGYLTLAYFLTVKLLWISVVATTAYLLIACFGDLCETLLSPRQPGGLALASVLGLSERHQAQASTLLAGIGRTVLLIVALLIALMPSGSSPSELLESITLLDLGNKPLAGMKVLPGDIVMAVALLVGGLVSIRIVKNWLSDRLLPETNMDAGMRASLVTLVGYLGYVLLAIVVMSTLSISLTNLTWVVSALSVGIGFGLQAIVQNFISGLILLTERPVKVGDWVSLAGVEGDIRRINVRATEIQMSDRSTVIVPNSQFITQNVRNVTMGNALGVVGISLTLPLDTDVLQIRELLLNALNEHESILDAPAPSVSFKDLTSNGLIISASGYVNSPRSVSGARSDLLFTILGRLRDLGVTLTAPQSMLLINEAQNVLPVEKA